MNELASIVAAATPLVYAAIGETITERAGVVNLSMEGSLMLSALTGFAVAFETGSTVAGFLAAMAVAMVMAGIVAVAGIQFRLNQIAVGFVLTLLAIELSQFLGDPWVGQPGTAVQVSATRVPGLSRIPFLGPVLFNHNLSVYGSYVAIAGAFLFLFKTRRGLDLQGVGERPEAAHSRGVPVNRLRYLYTILGGALIGIGGAAFSLDVKLGWREGLTTNYGWIVLALVIFGGWHPVRVAFGAYLFGALQLLALKLQPRYPSLTQILSLLPFVLMIATLVLVYLDRLRALGDRFPALRRLLASEAPSALGTTFRPE